MRLKASLKANWRRSGSSLKANISAVAPVHAIASAIITLLAKPAGRQYGEKSITAGVLPSANMKFPSMSPCIACDGSDSGTNNFSICDTTPASAGWKVISCSCHATRSATDQGSNPEFRNRARFTDEIALWNASQIRNFSLNRFSVSIEPSNFVHATQPSSIHVPFMDFIGFDTRKLSCCGISLNRDAIQLTCSESTSGFRTIGPEAQVVPCPPENRHGFSVARKAARTEAGGGLNLESIVFTMKDFHQSFHNAVTSAMPLCEWVAPGCCGHGLRCRAGNPRHILSRQRNG